MVRSYYYIKATHDSKKRAIVRFVGLAMMVLGILLVSWLAFPLFFWYTYFLPSSSLVFVTPIPESVSSKSLMDNFLAASTRAVFDQDDYDGAKTISAYTLSIPKLSITKAYVSTIDTRLSEHLVQYPSTVLPPMLGTAVIFGHSTLPPFFNQKNYKTIFTNLHKLKKGDEIVATVDNVDYTYIVERVAIAKPDNQAIFAQRRSGNFLTLVTCTPPGTKWRRLVVQSKLQGIGEG